MNTDRSDALLERMMTLHPKLIDLTLGRMERLLAALGHPEDQLPPVIHIAGTNGKGSTQAMLRAGFEAVGQTCHAYTSPHLVRFHERIRLGGALISEDHLSALLDECLDANGPDPITFFEITTAAALLAFARNPADWTLLEVGLGGRLDATNVVSDPRLCVITPVSIDHQQYLGETIEEIAAEKAGILKRGVPCIVARQREDALEVIEATAARVGAPLLVCGQHWHVWEERGRVIYQDETGLVDLPAPRLRGPHQVLNAGTVTAAFRHLGFGQDAQEAALTNAEWPARMQRLTSHAYLSLVPDAEIWLDGGHNEDAGAALAATLRQLPTRKTIVICGMLRTKDATGFLTHLNGIADRLFAVEVPDSGATFSASETRDAGEAAGLVTQTAPDVVSALRVIAGAEPTARIVICGSLYLAGAVLREA